MPRPHRRVGVPSARCSRAAAAAIPRRAAVAGGAGGERAGGERAGERRLDLQPRRLSRDVLARINQVRASGADCGVDGVFGAAAALAWNDKLTAAAEGHSQDMAAKNYFSHTSADGRTLADRVNASGYAWSSAGENIAAGYSTVNAVMDGWIASPGHCANLMNAGFTEVGVVCVPGRAGTTYSTYWTMDLGRPR